MTKKVAIEIIAKTIIVFTCVSVIASQFEDYVFNLYGHWGRVALLLGSNIIAMVGMNIYFSKQLPKRLKAEFFKRHMDECLQAYQTSKQKLLFSGENYYNNPFHLIHAIATQEHLLESYTDHSLEADYIKIKHSLLTALHDKDSDKLLADMGRMKALLARFEYVYKK